MKKVNMMNWNVEFDFGGNGVCVGHSYVFMNVKIVTRWCLLISCICCDKCFANDGAFRDILASYLTCHSLVITLKFLKELYA